MSAVPWFEILVGSYVLWVLAACASLLMSRRSPASTLAWMFAFIALPVVSGLYYMVFGPRRLQRRQRRYGIARERLAGHTDQAKATEIPKLAPDGFDFSKPYQSRQEADTGSQTPAATDKPPRRPMKTVAALLGGLSSKKEP